MGYKVDERKISIDELTEAYDKGLLQEVFGTGTAATIAMIKELKYKDFVMHFDTDTFKAANELRDRMNAIKDGTAEDKYGWLLKV
jgi:branched-chain amino acid aminotransferase